MFKILTLIVPQSRTSSLAPVANYYADYAIACPKGLLPVLQKLLTNTILVRHYDHSVVTDLRMEELLELDFRIARYQLDEAHNLLLDGRELGFLRRYLDAALIEVGRSRVPLSAVVDNHHLWIMLSQFQLAARHPTNIVNLSFSGRL